MSYRCGIGPDLAHVLGVEPGGPRVMCDSCGLILRVREDRMPPKWLMDGKPPPKWRTQKHEDGTRTDWCPECKTKQQAAEVRS